MKDQSKTTPYLEDRFVLFSKNLLSQKHLLISFLPSILQHKKPENTLLLHLLTTTHLLSLFH
ncbi:hypothetical protein RDI58_027426 [Solanum bulbocastanum]|uniref:Uncharacterized protein n=1 Tax=Solanum bulbocastanum TaxID=147425 RepID=A0AAN8Y1T0_SOLBU